MERFPRTLTDAVQLIQLSDLLKATALTVVDEWAKEAEPKLETGDVDHSSHDTPRLLPSHKLHDSQRTILNITGALTELLAAPYSRIQEVACQYWESRALYIAAERRMPDMLAEAGEHGMDVKELGRKDRDRISQALYVPPSGLRRVGQQIKSAYGYRLKS